MCVQAPASMFSSAQQNALRRFKAVAGINDSATDGLCTELLAACDWDDNRAIVTFFDEGSQLQQALTKARARQLKQSSSTTTKPAAAPVRCLPFALFFLCVWC